MCRKELAGQNRREDRVQVGHVEAVMLVGKPGK